METGRAPRRGARSIARQLFGFTNERRNWLAEHEKLSLLFSLLPVSALLPTRVILFLSFSFSNDFFFDSFLPLCPFPPSRSWRPRDGGECARYAVLLPKHERQRRTTRAESVRAQTLLLQTRPSLLVPTARTVRNANANASSIFPLCLSPSL